MASSSEDRYSTAFVDREAPGYTAHRGPSGSLRTGTGADHAPNGRQGLSTSDVGAHGCGSAVDGAACCGCDAGCGSAVDGAACCGCDAGCGSAVDGAPRIGYDAGRVAPLALGRGRWAWRSSACSAAPPVAVQEPDRRFAPPARPRETWAGQAAAARPQTSPPAGPEPVGVARPAPPGDDRSGRYGRQRCGRPRPRPRGAVLISGAPARRAVRGDRRAGGPGQPQRRHECLGGIGRCGGRPGGEHAVHAGDDAPRRAPSPRSSRRALSCRAPSCGASPSSDGEAHRVHGARHRSRHR